MMNKTISKILLGITLVSLLAQCKKSSTENVILPNHSKEELSVVRQKTLNAILNVGKNPDFKEFILTECLKQAHGDYNVYLKDIVAAYKGKPGYEVFATDLEA